VSFSSDQPLLTNQLPISIDFPKDQERFLEEIELFSKRVSNVVNTKIGGLFSSQEFANSSLYNVSTTTVSSNVYRKCFDLTVLNGGNILAGATVNFPHNIVGIARATLIYAGCTSTVPEFFSVMGYPTIYLTTTDIFFTNPLAATDLTSVLAVCEYLKN
jgi:hypothetical protein